jgi:ribosome biogenesis GTPase
LIDLGWNRFFENQRGSSHPHAIAARVAEATRERYRLIAEPGEKWAELAGRLRAPGECPRPPVVGDWVLTSWSPDPRARIERIFSAHTQFSRKAAGKKTQEQVLAANIDLVFLVTSLSGDFNPRRLERYLAVSWESGARPVVVLNKSDLSGEAQDRKAEVESLAIGVAILVTSAVTGEGLDELRACIQAGETAAFLGSSGVGKSALINALMEEASQRVGPVRERDGRGQHTTASGRLLLLRGGAVLIDTPGLRELQLWDAEEGIDVVFDDICALAARCRFRDCAHETEPGCAVAAARASGELDAARLAGFRKLEREQEFFRTRRDHAVRAEQVAKFKRLIREQRRFYRDRGRG